MHVLWNYPPSGSALLARALNRAINDTCVVAIVDVNNVNNNKPPGYSDYGSNSAANWAKRVADHLEYQGFTLGHGSSSDRAMGGVVCPLNWGVGSVHLPLCGHASDIVESVPPGQGCRRYSLFTAGARATGVGTLHQDTTDRATALKAECDARGLCYPAIWMIDNEDRAAVQFSCKNGDVSPADDDGSWPEMAASAKYVLQPVVDLPSSKTLSNLVSEHPAETRTVPPNYFFIGLENQGWCKNVYAPIEERVHDFALYATCGAVVASIFPGIKYCNYALQLATSATYPVRDLSNRWLYWSHGSSITMHITLQHPRCYGPAIIGQQYDPSNNALHGLGTTNQEVWRNFTLGQGRACVASGIPALPCIEVAGTVSGDCAGQYTPTDADITWLLNRYKELGINDVLHFNPSPPMSAGESTAIYSAITSTASGSAHKPKLSVGIRIGI